MIIDMHIKAPDLNGALDNFFAITAKKIRLLNKKWDPEKGSPVFTRAGKYSSRGWTEWTQGFQFGCQILQFDATDDTEFLEMGRENTVRYMAPHVSHIGVHDHGFNNVSTYGNLRRLALEGRTDESKDAIHFYEMALKTSGAVQAARWTDTNEGLGFMHSFNGPHSLFSDTVRSCRALVLAHQLGHVLMGENDRRISLIARAIEHALSTARHNVYYGEGRDAYDIRGRVVHESIFNTKDGRYRCPSTQQGYSPFTTWTRGLAWVLLGYAELLESFAGMPEAPFNPYGGKEEIQTIFLMAATAAADFFIANTPTDGIPYWDTGAPGLEQMPGYLDRPAEIDNAYEPVDSSAAVITAQGLLRLGKLLGAKGKRYTQAGLTVARTLFAPPYLSTSYQHEGILLHSVYHRPNGWDYVPKGKKVPQGESSMWGDFHAMELAVYLMRVIKGGPYLAFYDRG
ncbi:MAG: glycoside hydrolase family 88 protein [Candidatus Hydrogenedentes bacterium]|nr:glycoside hydrolase family 88 protein [Candidatus Hydrogenedentota bacterium]